MRLAEGLRSSMLYRVLDVAFRQQLGLAGVGQHHVRMVRRLTLLPGERGK